MNSNLKSNEKFWQVLKTLLELKSSESLNSLCKTLEVDKEVVKTIASLLRQLGHPLETLKKGNQEWLKASPQKEKEVVIKLNLFKWLQLQSLYPQLMSLFSQTKFKEIEELLYQVRREAPCNDFLSCIEGRRGDLLLRLLNQRKEENNGEEGIMESHILEALDAAILERNTLELMVQSGKKVVAFPRYVSYLDGDLTLIAEQLRDGFLFSLEVDKIEDFNTIYEDYDPRFSEVEVEDFINSVRSISDNEIRLVLKIDHQEDLNFIPKHHYLGNPCLVVNDEGQYIWAATVERSRAFYDWLFTRRNKIDIISPENFKDDFFNYCEELEKKKAS